MLDIRHLRYFLAVAEELHFGRAAKRLHMSQPPLSKRISDLERQLGVQLFRRLPGGVVLSEQGRAFMPHAQEALDAFLRAETVLRRSSSDRSNRLRMAFPPDTSAGVVATVTRGVWQNGYQIEVSEASTAQQAELLRAEAIDIGVMRHPYPARGLESSPPLCKPLGVAVSAGHPIASRASVEVAELNGHPLLMFPRDLAPDLHDLMLRQCKAHGYVPERIAYAARLADALLLLGRSVMLTPAEATACWPEVVWVPLAGSPLEWRTSVVVPRPHRAHEVLQQASSLTLEALRREEGWRPVR